MKSWIEIAPNSDFSIYNLPFGIFKTKDKEARAGVAIGSQIINLVELAKENLISVEEKYVSGTSLNSFIKLGKPTTSKVRLEIQQMLLQENDTLQSRTDKARFFVPQAEAEMLMPVEVGDYTDFYSSIDHATNVGKMFRDPNNALLPNWRHLPVGYHGRASSIVISGTNIHRPKGQSKPVETEPPIYGASQRFDFELEVAFVLGKETKLGETISTEKAEEYIFGLVLFNDLSARDIQNWEYVPLGPFLGKNFGSVISPWIVTLEALEPFRVEGYKQEPAVLPYLEYTGKKNYDIQLEVNISKPTWEKEAVICQSNFKFMYWNMCQQLAHHTVNGCNVRVGDMMASGTISGPEPHQFGSMLELAWKGTKPIPMPDGTERKFLADNDICTMRGFAEKDGIRVGFGECKTTVLPAL